MTEPEMSSSMPSCSGWICLFCGKWVTLGEDHVCGNISYTTYSYYPCCSCMAQVNNLIRKIDELITKLEAKQP